MSACYFVGPHNNLSFSYDASGTRTTTTVNGNAQTTLWDRQSGTPVSHGNQSFVQGAGALAQIDTSNNRSYLHADGVGSIRGLSDGAGALVGSADFDIFGAPQGQSGVASAFGYANALVTPEMINGSHAVWGISDPALFGAPTAAAPASAPSALQRALAAQQRLQSVNPKLDNQTGNNSAVSYRDYAKANSAHGDGNIGVFGPSSFHKPAVPAPSLTDPVARSQAANPQAAASHKPGNWSSSSGFGLAETTDQQHLLAFFLVSFDSYQAADGLTGLGAIIGKAFLYIACVLSSECLDILTELKDVIAQFGSAAPEDYLWGAEQLLDAVGLWPLLPKIQAAMPWLMSFTMSMIPGWGDLYDLASAVMGYDLITGQPLEGWQRWLTVAAVLIPFVSGAELRASDNFLEAEADLARSFERGCSFGEDTPVTTKQGEKPIHDIGIGDQVLAWDEQTHTTGYYTVTATMAHIDPQIVHLTINGETIETTPEHPFYVVVHDSWLSLVERGEWVTAGELQVGDAIRKADGTSGTVSQVNVTADTQVMYNLTVERAHTYVVGDGQWVVHNASCPLLDSITYADESYTGMTNRMQRAVIDTIREEDRMMLMAWRGSEPGSYIWHGTEITAKPKGAETLWAGECGLRFCRVGASYGYYGSDLDGAWAVFGDGKSVDDRYFMRRIAPKINERYGVPIVMHGNYIPGLQAGVSGTSWSRINDQVHIFGQFGYVGSAPMWQSWVDAQQGVLRLR